MTLHSFVTLVPFCGVNEAKPHGLRRPAKRRLGRVSGFVVKVVNEVTKAVSIEYVQELAETLFLARPTVVLKHQLAHFTQLAAAFQLAQHRQLLSFDIELEKVDSAIDVIRQRLDAHLDTILAVTKLAARAVVR